MRIDLHTHTTCSDGTDTATELLWAAQRSQLDVVGITDHDTASGWEAAAQEVENTGVALVRGMEITTRWENLSVHLLGYLFDAEYLPLRMHCQKMQTARNERLREMVENIAADYPLSWEDILEVGEQSRALGRPHIADALVKKGIVANRSAAFATILHPSGKYYVNHYAPPTPEVISWLVAAGGKAVVAHPRAPKRGKMLSVNAFRIFCEAGLFGVEIEHRDNLPEFRPTLVKLAQELGLAAFGASDYHGFGKPNQLGENTTSAEVLAELSRDTYLPIVFPTTSAPC